MACARVACARVACARVACARPGGMRQGGMRQGGEYSCRCHGKRVISAPSKPLKLKLAGHIL